jgi:hypothetical protein
MRRIASGWWPCPHWRALAVALGRRVQGPPQVLRLAPTARSRLR